MWRRTTNKENFILQLNLVCRVSDAAHLHGLWFRWGCSVGKAFCLRFTWPGSEPFNTMHLATNPPDTINRAIYTRVWKVLVTTPVHLCICGWCLAGAKRLLPATTAWIYQCGYENFSNGSVPSRKRDILEKLLHLWPLTKCWRRIRRVN